MTITKTLEVKSNGKIIKFKVERTKKVQDNIAYADGWNIDLGKETVDIIHIRVFIDDKHHTSSYKLPQVIADENLIAKGAYAQLGNVFLTEENFNKLMNLIAEIESEFENIEEFEEVKTQELAKETAKNLKYEKDVAEYEKLIASGMCRKCGTWCYVDCEN